MQRFSSLRSCASGPLSVCIAIPTAPPRRKTVRRLDDQSVFSTRIDSVICLRCLRTRQPRHACIVAVNEAIRPIVYRLESREQSRRCERVATAAITVECTVPINRRQENRSCLYRRQDAAAQESTDDSRQEIEISVALTSRRSAWFMRRNAAVMGTWLQKSR